MIVERSPECVFGVGEVTNTTEERCAISGKRRLTIVRKSRESVSLVGKVTNTTEGRSRSVSVEWEEEVQLNSHGRQEGVLLVCCY